MMLVDLEHIPNGAVLARPVFNPERSGQPLLQPGSALTRRVVDRLVDMRIPMIWVRPEEDPSGARADERVSQADTVLARAGVLLQLLRAQLHRVEHRGTREFKISELSPFIHALASEMSHAVDHEPPVFQLAWHGGDMAAHMTNTVYYSLLMATNMPKYLRGQRHTNSAELWEALRQLGQAALLHDVGKLQDAERYACRSIEDTPNELTFDPQDAGYVGHPKAGAEAFREGLHSAIVYVIANHHQRFNGEGFPLRPGDGGTANMMCGERIHIFARFVSLANVLDHLLDSRVQTSQPVQRLRSLLDLQQDTRFDPVLFNAALRLIPPFPVGTQVLLTDGAPAVVLRNNVYQPCRPVVARQPQENEFPHPDLEPVDLSEKSNLSVAQVGGVNVQEHLYDAPTQDPDPLDYWALRDVLNRVPTEGPELAQV